jgi:hypothetical protein
MGLGWQGWVLTCGNDVAVRARQVLTIVSTAFIKYQKNRFIHYKINDIALEI